VTAPSATNGGTSFNFTVTAQNPIGATTDTAFIGTVHFTSSDSQAVLPADYTFTTADQGAQSFAATLTTDGSETVTARETVNTLITGSATITVSTPGNVAFSPTFLVFYPYPVGVSSPPKAVTLTNSSSRVIAISSITFGGMNPGDFSAFSTTCRAILPINKSCVIRVKSTPTAVGSRSGTLIITDNAANSPQTVSLIGAGIPQVTLTPSSLLFATRTVGTTSSAKKIIVKNNLDRILNITGIGFTGADPGDFVSAGTTCGTSVASGKSCTFSVAFKPLATGSRTAALTVSDDASPTTQSTDLSGTGK
jgi:hypothetical protein